MGYRRMMAGVIYCPHCREQLTANHECRGFTRRFLFGLFAGAVASMAIPDVWGAAELLPRGLLSVRDGDMFYAADHTPFDVWGDRPGGNNKFGVLYHTLRTIDGFPKQVRNHASPQHSNAMMLVRPTVPFWKRARSA